MIEYYQSKNDDHELKPEDNLSSYDRSTPGVTMRIKGGKEYKRDDLDVIGEEDYPQNDYTPGQAKMEVKEGEDRP